MVTNKYKYFLNFKNILVVDLSIYLKCYADLHMEIPAVLSVDIE